MQIRIPTRRSGTLLRKRCGTGRFNRRGESDRERVKSDSLHKY